MKLARTTVTRLALASVRNEGLSSPEVERLLGFVEHSARGVSR